MYTTATAAAVLNIGFDGRAARGTEEKMTRPWKSALLYMYFFLGKKRDTWDIGCG